MELRPYQQKAVESVIGEWSKGNDKTLLVLPTGTGKTICFAKVAEDCVSKGERVLILAHRGELLEQASDKIKKSTGLSTALEKASFSALNAVERITVGSVQSLQIEKRLDAYPTDYFQTIIVDEAHHVLAEGYQKVLNHFSKTKLLGVTATPDRGDMKNLGQVFKSIAFEYTLPQAIRDHYLCPIKAMTIPLDIDISNVGISQGDFKPGEIGTALDPYLEQIANEMLTYCKGRKTVVFLPLIATSQKFTELLNSKGFRACEVNGNSENRKEILEDFDKGRYEVLCNSMLLTEGWDCPTVDCVIVLRPTKVRSLYAQMIGRGTRLHPTKKDLLILDFLWHTAKHELCHPASLICKDEVTAKKMTEMLEKEPVQMDLQDAEKLAAKSVLEERESALAKKLEEMRKRKKKLVDPLQYEFSIMDEDLINYVPSFGWEMSPPTEKQIETLEKFGILPESIDNSGKASLLLDRLMKRSKEGLSTPKQIRFLEQRGFQKVGTWSFDAANRMISRISMNNWMIPRGINPETYLPN